MSQINIFILPYHIKNDIKSIFISIDCFIGNLAAHVRMLHTPIICPVVSDVLILFASVELFFPLLLEIAKIIDIGDRRECRG